MVSTLAGLSQSETTGNANATFSLLLPGNVLYFNALNELRKFRGRGNKDGAKQAWECLQNAGLGSFATQKAARGCAQVRTTIYAEIFTRRKFSPISPSALFGENFIRQIFCPVLMITQRIWRPLPHWRKFIPLKWCCVKQLCYSRCAYFGDLFITVQLYEFHKRPVPEDSEEKQAFVTSLMEFGVSLKQYKDAFAMNNITM